MRSFVAALAAASAWLALSGAALAQSGPCFIPPGGSSCRVLQTGDVPTIPQWNSFFAAKQDFPGGGGAPPSGAIGDFQTNGGSGLFGHITPGLGAAAAFASPTNGPGGFLASIPNVSGSSNPYTATAAIGAPGATAVTATAVTDIAAGQGVMLWAPVGGGPGDTFAATAPTISSSTLVSGPTVAAHGSFSASDTSITMKGPPPPTISGGVGIVDISTGCVFAHGLSSWTGTTATLSGTSGCASAGNADFLGFQTGTPYPATTNGAISLSSPVITTTYGPPAGLSGHPVVVDFNIGQAIGTLSTWVGTNLTLQSNPTCTLPCNFTTSDQLGIMTGAMTGPTIGASNSFSTGATSIPVSAGPTTAVAETLLSGASVTAYNVTTGATIGPVTAWNNAATFKGSIVSNGQVGSTWTGTLTISSVLTGAAAIGEQLYDLGGVIPDGTAIVSGSGSIWQVAGPNGPIKFASAATIFAGGALTIPGGGSASNSAGAADQIALLTNISYYAATLDSDHIDARGGHSGGGVGAAVGPVTLTGVSLFFGAQNFAAVAVIPGDIGASATAGASFAAGDLAIAVAACPAGIAYNQPIYDQTLVQYIGQEHACGGASFSATLCNTLCNGSGKNLNVTGSPLGLTIGQRVLGAGITAGTKINTCPTTGCGTAGKYTTNNSSSVLSPETMTSFTLQMQENSPVASSGSADVLKFRLGWALWRSVGGVADYWINDGYISWLNGFSSVYNDSGYCDGGKCLDATGAPAVTRPFFIPQVHPTVAQNDWAVRSVTAVAGGTALTVSPPTVTATSVAPSILHDESDSFAAAIAAGSFLFVPPAAAYNLSRPLMIAGNNVNILCAGRSANLNPVGTGDLFDVAGQEGSQVTGIEIDNCYSNSAINQALGYALYSTYTNKLGLKKDFFNQTFNGLIENQFVNNDASDVTLTNMAAEPLQGFVTTGDRSSAFGQIDMRHNYVQGMTKQPWPNLMSDGVGFDVNGSIATVVSWNSQAENISGEGYRVSNARGAPTVPLGPAAHFLTSEFSTGEAVDLSDGTNVSLTNVQARASGFNDLVSCPLSSNIFVGIAGNTVVLGVTGGRNDNAVGAGAYLAGANARLTGQNISGNSALNRTAAAFGTLGPAGIKGACPGVEIASSNNSVVGNMIGGDPTYQSAPIVVDSGNGNVVAPNAYPGNVVSYPVLNSANGVPFNLGVFTIAGLPSCSINYQGVTAHVTNGVASPGFLSTAGSTGSSYDPVICNGSTWVYGG